MESKGITFFLLTLFNFICFLKKVEYCSLHVECFKCPCGSKTKQNTKFYSGIGQGLVGIFVLAKFLVGN